MIHRCFGMIAAVVLSAAACGPRTPAPAPLPAPAAEAEPPPPPRPPLLIDGASALTACLVRNGRMTMTPIDFDPATGDTTIGGRPFREVYPVTAAYVAAAPWNAADLPITFRGQWYVRSGLPRFLHPSDLEALDVFQGVTVFAERGVQARQPEVIYFPFTPDCQFQPYEIAEVASAVRG